MASCRECDATIDDRARYCSECGAATADDIEVLGAESAVTSSETVGRPGVPSNRVLLVVGLVVALGLFWTVARSGSGDRPVAEGAASDASEDSADAATDPATEADAERDDEPEAAQVRDEQADEERATSTSALDAETTAPTIGEGPLLGREVGLSLLVGGRNLRRVNLDTAEVIEYEVRGDPVLVDDGWLVLLDSSQISARSVRLRDPDGADPVRLSTGDVWPGSVLRSSEPGTAWFLDTAAAPPSWQLIRLADGEAVDEAGAGLGPFNLVGSEPLLASTPDGGVYEWNGASFDLITEGGLIAASDGYVLLTRCQSPGDCSLVWVDRADGRTIERPTPAGSDFHGGNLSPGGRVLTLWRFDNPVLFDVERGVEIPAASGSFYGPDEVAVSPDERYVAVVADQPTIYDLDTGQVFVLDLSGGHRGVLFVDNG